MDFTQAALLIAAVFAITRLLDLTIPQLVGWKLQLANEVVGVGVTLLVAYSTYASSVVVGGHSLDKVNFAGVILIGLMIAGGATVVDQVGVRAISNIGENRTTRDLPKAA